MLRWPKPSGGLWYQESFSSCRTRAWWNYRHSWMKKTGKLLQRLSGPSASFKSSALVTSSICQQAGSYSKEASYRLSVIKTSSLWSTAWRRNCQQALTKFRWWKLNLMILPYSSTESLYLQRGVASKSKVKLKLTLEMKTAPPSQLSLQSGLISSTRRLQRTRLPTAPWSSSLLFSSLTCHLRKLGRLRAAPLIWKCKTCWSSNSCFKDRTPC